MLYNRSQLHNQYRENQGQFFRGIRPWSKPVSACNTLMHVTTPWGAQQVGYCMPEADVLELDDQFVLEIALAGVVLDDIECRAEEGLITVIAKRTPAMFEERAAIIAKELPAGYLIRQFEFNTPILHEQVEARMERGILFVSVPKLNAAVRVPISAGSIEREFTNLGRTRVESSSASSKETARSGKEVHIK